VPFGITPSAPSESVDEADLVHKSDYDANTILKADTDNAPAALTIGASRIVGRAASGGIAALTVSDVKTLLGLTDEDIQDLIGGMVSGNTETNITVTYDDTNGKLNFVASGGGGGAANLADLGDVDLTGLASGNFLKYNGSDWVVEVLDKSDVGLSAVDNTSDSDKPISDDTQAALDLKIDESVLDANTVMYADSDNTPAALPVGASTFVGRKAAGGISAMSVSEVLTLLGLTTEELQDLVGGMVSGGTETNITVTYDDTNARLDFVVDDVTKVSKSLFDAHTLLYATTDNTPAALTVGASTFVGRKASGDIAAMSVAEALTLLGLTTEEVQDLIGAMIASNTESGGTLTYDDTNGKLDLAVDDTTKVAKSLYDANSILYATTDDTPVALTVGASTIVGRKASGNIVAMSTSELLTLLGRTDEDLQDFIGAMFSGNVESGGSLTYDDTNGKLDFNSEAFGFPFTVDPGAIRGTDSLPLPAANNSVYQRVREGGTITKVGMQVAVSSGNISVAVYRNSGTARSAVPGTRLATTGAIACPSAGYAEVTLDASATLYAGDWISLSADNGTATFRTLLANVFDSNLGLGRQLRQASAHPAPSTPASLIGTIGNTFVLVGVP
jgi:hypothetical protein